MYLGNVASDKPINAHDRLRSEAYAKIIRYVAYPSFERVRRYEARVDEQRHPPNNRNNVFVGQVPNLMPLPYLAWCLDTALGEYGVRWLLQTTKNGCAKVWCRDDIAQNSLLKRNKCVLFDVCGMWTAETDEGTKSIADYVENLRRDEQPCDPRLPRSLMVLEGMKNQSFNPFSGGNMESEDYEFVDFEARNQSLLPVERLNKLAGPAHESADADFGGLERSDAYHTSAA